MRRHEAPPSSAPLPRCPLGHTAERGCGDTARKQRDLGRCGETGSSRADTRGTSHHGCRSMAHCPRFRQKIHCSTQFRRQPIAYLSSRGSLVTCRPDCGTRSFALQAEGTPGLGAGELPPQPLYAGLPRVPGGWGGQRPAVGRQEPTVPERALTPQLGGWEAERLSLPCPPACLPWAGAAGDLPGDRARLGGFLQHGGAVPGKTRSRLVTHSCSLLVKVRTGCWKNNTTLRTVGTSTYTLVYICYESPRPSDRSRRQPWHLRVAGTGGAQWGV